MVQLTTTIVAVAAVGAASMASASPTNLNQIQSSLQQLKFDLNSWNWSCKAPWKPSSKPNYTFGCSAPGIPYWSGGDKAACKWFWNAWTPFCKNGNPSKPLPGNCNPPKDPSNNPVCQDGYQQIFSDYTTNATSGVYQGTIVGAATIDNDNYMTYVLTTTVQGCLDMCDQTSGCAFVNVYQDNAASASDIAELPASAQAQYQQGQLTCALYKACSGTDKATNYGGQQDPTFITQSAGYCKGAQCSTTTATKK